MSDLKLGKVDLSAVANCERDGGVPLHAAVQTSVTSKQRETTLLT